MKAVTSAHKLHVVRGDYNQVVRYTFAAAAVAVAVVFAVAFVAAFALVFAAAVAVAAAAVGKLAGCTVANFDQCPYCCIDFDPLASSGTCYHTWAAAVASHPMLERMVRLDLLKKIPTRYWDVGSFGR